EARHVLNVLPDDPDSLFNLATVLALQGKPLEAVAYFQKLLRVKPDDSEAHFHLALALADAGQREQSLRELRETVRLKSDHIGAMNNLAWTFATSPDDRVRNGTEAVELAERIRQLPGG